MLCVISPSGLTSSCDTVISCNKTWWINTAAGFNRRSSQSPVIHADLRTSCCVELQNFVTWKHVKVIQPALTDILKQNVKTKKKKQWLYRPGEAPRFPGVWGSQISRQLAHEGGKFVSPTHRSPLLLRKYSWYSFLIGTKSTAKP
jgi:hypothetical protein